MFTDSLGREYTKPPGRPSLFTPEQRKAAVERYKLFQANRPTAICAQYGISKETLLSWVRAS
jgi:transposase-like protein